ncbi:MAG: hypothetical protein N2314_05310 [Brevinematales bacterium]|nr:hypothetical protein [Brevinematales bacterium]
MKYSILFIGVFWAFCTLLLYGEESYTTSISLVQTNGEILLSWLANVEKGEFVVFGSGKPIVSLEVLQQSSKGEKVFLVGQKQQNLYRYLWKFSSLGYPYVAILPSKEKYTEEDIMPALNANLIAYNFKEKKEVLSSNGTQEQEIQKGVSLTFQVKGVLLQEKVVLSWFFEGYEGHEFAVYRVNSIPQLGVLRRMLPLARVKGTMYEDIPPVGGPYYYVIIQDGVWEVGTNQVVGPVWFPASPPPHRGVERQEML